jgi:hypothetical protein
LTTNQRVDAMQSLRVAMNAIGRDALNSGFGFPNTGATLPNNTIVDAAPLWMPADINPNVDLITSVMGANDVNSAPHVTRQNCIKTKFSTSNPVDPRLPCSDQVSFIYKDPTFTNLIAKAAPGSLKASFPFYASLFPLTKMISVLGAVSPEVKFINASAPQQSTTYYLDGALKMTGVNGDGSEVTIDTKGADATASTPDDLNLGSLQLQEGDLFVIVGGSSAAFGTLWGGGGGGIGADKFLFAANDPLGLNVPATYDAAVPGSGSPIARIPSGAAYKVTWVAYRVIYEDQTDPTPETGTLVRTVFGNPPGQTTTTKITDTPIAYNIEDMQVQYVMTDGSVHDSTTAIDPWQVTQVNVTLTALSPVEERRSGAQFKVTLSSTFNTRNISYDVR